MSKRQTDNQRPGSEAEQAPRVREFSPSDSRSQPLNQEDRKGPSGSRSNNPKPSITRQ